MAVPLVSILIVNWNGKKELTPCLQSIQRQSFDNYEVIFVDNGSKDGSADFVEQNFPFARVVRLAENRGFTGGNNEGLKYARGEFIALLNNDAILSENWLHVMLTAMKNNGFLGSCSSKIIISGTNLIDSVGNEFTTAGSGLKKGEYQNADNFTESMEVHGACAAAVIYRKKMLDEIGFLDEDLFLNYEDTDLDFRALLAGWKSMFVPEAVVYHKVSSTIGKLSDSSVYYFSRNSFLVWLKNMPFRLIVRYFHHRLLYEIFSFLYYGIIHKKWRAFLNGKVGSIRLIPKMIRKRNTIQRMQKVTTVYLKSVFIPIHKNILQRSEVFLKMRGKNSSNKG